MISCMWTNRVCGVGEMRRRKRAKMRVGERRGNTLLEHEQSTEKETMSFQSISILFNWINLFLYQMKKVVVFLCMTTKYIKMYTLDCNYTMQKQHCMPSCGTLKYTVTMFESNNPMFKFSSQIFSVKQKAALLVCSEGLNRHLGLKQSVRVQDCQNITALITSMWNVEQILLTCLKQLSFPHCLFSIWLL